MNVHELILESWEVAWDYCEQEGIGLDIGHARVQRSRTSWPRRPATNAGSGGYHFTRAGAGRGRTGIWCWTMLSDAPEGMRFLTRY